MNCVVVLIWDDVGGSMEGGSRKFQVLGCQMKVGDCVWLIFLYRDAGIWMKVEGRKDVLSELEKFLSTRSGVAIYPPGMITGLRCFVMSFHLEAARPVFLVEVEDWGN